MDNLFELSEEQKNAFYKLKMKENVFLTGPAGVGKSILINYYNDYCLNRNIKVHITAMTGCAAYLINGITLHSWAGIGLGNKDISKLINKIRRNNNCKNRWLETDVLIIDEVSMLTGELLDKLNKIAKILRRNNRPFGGIQLILTGDLLQLPPIIEENNEYNEEDISLFCFEAECWNECIDRVIELKKIQRQNNPIFQKCLNEVRFGNVSRESKEFLHDIAQKKWQSINGIIPTRLYSCNKDVDRINNDEIKKLNNVIKTYNVKTDIDYFENLDLKIDKSVIDHISCNYDDSSIYISSLQLAVNAQVMLTKNLDVENGLVNGSRGIIVGFNDDNPIVRFINGRIEEIKLHTWNFDNNYFCKIKKKQYPLKLAWAISIHKSQGTTLDFVEISIGSSVFQYGQSYVALSRAKNADNLYIKSLKFKRIKAHPKILEFYKNINYEVSNKTKITHFFANV